MAGFPENSVFDQLSIYVNFVFGRVHKLVAEIYRAAAEILPQIRAVQEDILEATFQAGKELVESMQISPETMERITQPVTDIESHETHRPSRKNASIHLGGEPSNREKKGTGTE